VSAEEGSKTFVGANEDRINWKKFEILSEVILPIMKSQVVAYSGIKRRDDIRELILDCKMSTDEEVRQPIFFSRNPSSSETHKLTRPYRTSTREAYNWKEHQAQWTVGRRNSHGSRRTSSNRYIQHVTGKNNKQQRFGHF
jgi:phage regulator Rha-like protein